MKYRKIKVNGVLSGQRFGCTLNYCNNKWKKITGIYNALPPVTSHCCVTYKNNIILFGGTDPYLSRVYNDIYIFDCDKNEWKYIQTSNAPLPRYILVGFQRVYVMALSHVFIIGTTIEWYCIMIC